METNGRFGPVQQSIEGPGSDFAKSCRPRSTSAGVQNVFDQLEFSKNRILEIGPVLPCKASWRLWSSQSFRHYEKKSAKISNSSNSADRRGPAFRHWVVDCFRSHPDNHCTITALLRVILSYLPD